MIMYTWRGGYGNSPLSTKIRTARSSCGQSHFLLCATKIPTSITNTNNLSIIEKRAKVF